MQTVNLSWNHQTDEYVTLGLYILFKKHNSLQEFTNWLNEKICTLLANSKSNLSENQVFEITQPTLSRYLSGKISISKERGLILLKLIESELKTEEILGERIKGFSKDNWASINTRVILTDITLLTFVVIKKLLDSENLGNIDAIITPEADGIPLGVILAQQLKVKCIYVRKNKRSEDVDFVQVEAQRYRNVVNYYLSLKELPPNNNVLLVDDIKRSGSTLKHLEELVEKAGSKVTKKLVLIDVHGKNDIISEVDSFLKLTSV